MSVSGKVLGRSRPWALATTPPRAMANCLFRNTTRGPVSAGGWSVPASGDWAEPIGTHGSISSRSAQLASAPIPGSRTKTVNSVPGPGGSCWLRRHMRTRYVGGRCRLLAHAAPASLEPAGPGGPDPSGCRCMEMSLRVAGHRVVGSCLDIAGGSHRGRRHCWPGGCPASLPAERRFLAARARCI